MNQIYFTADLHFGHANILKHSPNRPYSDTVDIVAHDEWLLDLWQSTVDRRDTVYILEALKRTRAGNHGFHPQVGQRDGCSLSRLNELLSLKMPTNRFIKMGVNRF